MQVNKFNPQQIDCKSQVQAPIVASHGRGLGVLVLPEGEMVTLLPQAGEMSDAITPATEESLNQGYALPSARLLRPVVPQTEKALTFDKAVIGEMKAVRSEWHERSSRDGDGEQKQKKNKKRIKRLRKTKISFKDAYRVFQKELVTIKKRYSLSAKGKKEKQLNTIFKKDEQFTRLLLCSRYNPMGMPKSC